MALCAVLFRSLALYGNPLTPQLIRLIRLIRYRYSIFDTTNESND